MKLGLILFFCVLVVQKEAVQADQLESGNTNHLSDDLSDLPLESQSDSSHDENDDNSVSNGTTSESQGGQSDSFVKFSGDLYQAVKESQPQNFIFSPLSVRNALAMLSLGAVGETAEEMQKVLQLPADASDLINKQSNLISSLKSISSSKLGLRFATGDAVFTNSRFRVKQQFKDHVTRLGGETERVNFATSLAASRRINAWVHNKTAGKIEKFVEPSDLNDQISLLVLNSIYFKGAWKHEFNVSNTKQLPFSINASCSVNVEMMTQENEFQHADIADAEAQLLILPYQGKRLSMMIYLPWRKEEGALDTLENWLGTKSPFEIQREHFNEDELSTVSIFIPKFKIRSSLNLNEPLKTLGLGKMFDAVAANFSGIFNDSRNFFVSKVSQQTFIEVNERGTEAAAVTGSELAATSAPRNFKADRPFLFQIVDSKTRTILFSGRVKNPLDGTVASGLDSESEDGGPQCIGVKSKVEELLLDFANFLAPNETEPHNRTTRAARLQVFVEKHENKTAGALEFIQLLDSTLDKLERTEEESGNKTWKIQALEETGSQLEKAEGQCRRLVSSQSESIKSLRAEESRNLIRLEEKEKDVEDKARKIGEVEKERDLLLNWNGRCWNRLLSKNETIRELRKENGRLQTQRSEEQQAAQRNCPREGDEEKGHYVNFPRAAARVFECSNYNCHIGDYNATAHGMCQTSYQRPIESVQLTGSCVTMWEKERCEGSSFRLDKTNRDSGRVIANGFPKLYSYGYHYIRPKSIGPC